MSKKDYIRAAAIVTAIRLDSEHDADVAMQAFIRLFTNDTDRFDRATFVKACGGAA